ncbi:MAG: hypothetical protein Q9207_001080 [Kuettlingeria erythrocarpa]
MSTSAPAQSAKAAKEAASRRLRIKLARFSYRQNSNYGEYKKTFHADSKAPWIDVDRSYDSDLIEEGCPENPNVEQVTLSSKDDAIYGWQFTFARANMKYVHLEEYDVKYWGEDAPDTARRTFCVIRFLNVGSTTSEDVSEFPADNTAIAVDTSEFPLAKVCQDNDALKGKEIRIAWMKKGAKLTSMYGWQWPKAIQLLSNSRYDSVNDELSKGPLNPWAEKNKDGLEKVTLEKVEGDGKVEWRIHGKRSVSDYKLSASKQPTILLRTSGAVAGQPVGLPHPEAEAETPEGSAERPREDDDEEGFDAETARIEEEWRKANEFAKAGHAQVRGMQKEASRRDKAEKGLRDLYTNRAEKRKGLFGEGRRKK